MGKRIALSIFGGILLMGIVISIVGFALGGRAGYLTIEGEQLVYVQKKQTLVVSQLPEWIAKNLPRGITMGWYNNPVAEGAATLTSPDADEIFTGIKLDIDAGYVNIKVGDEPSLSVSGSMPYTARVENGVWVIKSNQSGISSFDNVKFWLNGEDMTTQFDLTLPKSLASADISMDLGSLRIEGLSADDIDIDVEMASLTLRDISAKRLEISTDLGAVQAFGMAAQQAKLKTNLGSIKFEGDVASHLEADCDVGSIDITLQRPDTYGYSASSDIGIVRIDGERCTGKQEGTPYYDLSCDIGSITVNFS